MENTRPIQSVTDQTNNERKVAHARQLDHELSPYRKARLLDVEGHHESLEHNTIRVRIAGPNKLGRNSEATPVRQPLPYQ